MPSLEAHYSTTTGQISPKTCISFCQAMKNVHLRPSVDGSSA
ncbi:hypothetical protein Tsp_05287, partial [Trichinella spiralis]